MRKLLYKFCLTFLLVFFAIPAFAQEKIVDNAGLLSPQEKASLTELVTSITSTYNFDLVIVTETNIGEYSTVDYADSFFDYYGYGLGQDRDGCIFLQVTESRDYSFRTTARGMAILNNTAFNKLENSTVKFLSAGNYYEAYRAFLLNWEEFLSLEERNRSYNFFHQWNALLVIISWLLSLAIGFIVVQTWKAQMNTAIQQTQAAAYVVPNSLSFKEKKDSFLYSTVTKIKRPDPPSSSGGVTRSGSSGGHSGRGGKY